MKWHVNKKLVVDQFQLLEILSNKVVTTPKEEYDVLGMAFADFAQSKAVLAQLTPQQLAGMAIALGYFYRIFLEKNEVEITSEQTEDEKIFNSDDVETSSETSNHADSGDGS